MFSNVQLQQLIEGKIIGGRFPYDTNDEREIEAHIRRLYHRINRIPNLICEAEWDHFGSGYASYVEFFCYRKEDLIVVEEKYGHREIKKTGIILDVCRLAPVAMMGEDERYETIHIESNEVVGGAYGSLLGRYRLLDLDEKYHRIAEQLKLALIEFDIELLETEKLNQSLNFQTKIPTIFRDPRAYLVMDAIFYWED
ncbi:hypothetical protein NC661_16680 [Aquibacillus koreensis]|uniref:Uncharacterized protein n=1 Tax=Aquibacillus koreensis TaxID=279446 RepID=A0A9X3WRD4_9BACI|nr:hypothetical protein [Aquibacillus koreensis]MCT2536859.1 hypothetical protein [Aquibacillus koreensis]MDC3422009.1 hypothetical protein [Aquibacillus koreensis]